jgi:hypothetical protein
MYFARLGTTDRSQQAQQFEYGSPDELRGVTKIYVNTGADLEARNNIVETIQKDLKQITVTDRPDDADVCLFYGAASNTFYAETWDHSTTIVNGATNVAYKYGIR